MQATDVGPLGSSIQTAELDDNSVTNAKTATFTTTKITVPYSLLSGLAIVNADVAAAAAIVVTKIANGSSGQYLKSGASNPAWTTGLLLSELGNLGGAVGDVIYWNGTNWVRLAIGSTNAFLKVVAGLPSWATALVVKQILAWTMNNTNLLTTAGVLYTAPGMAGTLPSDETVIQTPISIAGTLKNLYVNIKQNANAVDGTLKVRLNAATKTISVTITALTTGKFSDLTNTDAVAAGDLLSFITTQATTGNTGCSGIGIEFDPT